VVLFSEGSRRSLPRLGEAGGRGGEPEEPVVPGSYWGGSMPTREIELEGRRAGGATLPC